MHSRCNFDVIRSITDAIREEIEGKVAIFTTFTGGLITSKFDQNINQKLDQ